MTNETGSEHVREELPEELPATTEGPVGISGWLVLPAIGLVIGPVLGVVGLIYAATLFPDVAAVGFGGIYALELLVLTGILGLTIYAAILFFGKRRNAPSVMILLLAVGVGSSVFLLIVELGIGAEVFAEETANQLVRDVIAAAIWIPYFRVSRRVKATFVN